MKRCDNCGAPATDKVCRYCGHGKQEPSDDVKLLLAMSGILGSGFVERAFQAEKKDDQRLIAKEP
jgi:hypothetical protein